MLELQAFCGSNLNLMWKITLSPVYLAVSGASTLPTPPPYLQTVFIPLFLTYSRLPYYALQGPHSQAF